MDLLPRRKRNFFDFIQGKIEKKNSTKKYIESKGKRNLCFSNVEIFYGFGSKKYVNKKKKRYATNSHGPSKKW